MNQARQGNLVKIKRMKLVTDPVSAVADLASSFPDSLSTFDDLQEVSRKNPSRTQLRGKTKEIWNFLCAGCARWEGPYGEIQAGCLEMLDVRRGLAQASERFKLGV